MTDEQLLQSITTIIDKQIANHIQPLKKELHETFNEVDVLNSRLQYIEVTSLSALREVESIEKRLKPLGQAQELIGLKIDLALEKIVSVEKRQKRHGKKISFTNKTVDIMMRRDDTRIVQNMRDIDTIKTHVGLPITQ